MKKYILLITLYFTNFLIHRVNAQENIEILPANINFKSPQASEMGRYGNIGNKLAVGELDLNIPLISLNTKYSKAIDVYLTYNSNGFMPFKAPGIVGMNWNLFQGGVVNRKVNAIVDEYISDSPGTKFSGFLTGVRTDPKNKYCFYDFSCLNIGGLNFGIGSNNSGRYEGEPDLFTFNFMGYSGEFMIGNDGNPVVKSSAGNLKVDVSGIVSYSTLQRYKNKPASVIVFTDDRGIRYYFGESIDAIEFTTNLSDVFHSLSSTPSVNNSWYLTRVVFPNNEVINFSYDKLNLKKSSGLDYSTDQEIERDASNNYYNRRFLRSYYFTEFSGVHSSTVNCGSNYGCLYGYNSANGYNTTNQIQKKAYIKEIAYNDQKITFTYSDRGYKFYEVDALKNGNEIVIDNIVLTNNTRQIKKIQFNYQNKGGSHPRTFLTGLSINNIENYAFDYYKTDNLPSPHTYGTDHWGYWNGTAPLQPIYPAHSIDINTGEYQIVGTEKDSNPNLADVSLLKTISYPTKGSTEFIFEPHQYSKRIERNLQTNFLQGLYNKSGIVGGARVKQIINKDSNGNILYEKNYKYTVDYNSDVSSGILNNWPRYVYAYKEYLSGTQYNTLTHWVSSNLIPASLENANIYYKKVYEIINGKGYKESYFSNFEDTSDDYSNLGMYRIVLGSGTEATAQYQFRPYNLVKNLHGIYPNSKNNFRGNLLSEKYFNNNGLLLKEIQNVFNNEIDNSINSKYVVVNHETCLFYAQNYKYFFNSPQIKKTIITDFYNTGSTSTYTEQNYEEILQNNLLSKKTVSAENVSLLTEYRYANDSGNQLMISKNMIGIPLETTTTQTRGTTTRTLSKTETIYPLNQTEANAKTSGLVLPLSLKSFDLQNPASATTEVIYDQYDSTGNILQYTTKDGISTTIIWGYNQTQPIARIEGATYTQVQSLASGIVTASDTDASAAPNNDETSLLQALDAFRNNSALSSYQITTYTYDPLIGVRSITPPSGIREVYLYDTANRLKEIRQDSQTGKVLKEFKYNYKN
ncbi:hypothetical protein ODZ84_16195 [Chryseobacterium fluminis]|uniref:hypothetical protein n=1 Tax=Chryseobacterium fluminis TaxID=2983606 RepID=UPI00224E93DE|nr:hypothetical protein [Chryseobacterium sp. MMS21-Ot14]UZT96751.1 hypothetical protein ODZ84_16195 [Chryseobacterium sp. MMS21-Ot14]